MFQFLYNDMHAYNIHTNCIKENLIMYIRKHFYSLIVTYARKPFGGLRSNVESKMK